MKISVIMPVYNCELYLEKAISSVLSQKVELEIIAVDDKSTDSSAQILRKLAEEDSRIKPIFNEENMGVSAVRNIALKYATGDYVAFCDSDDVLPMGAYAALLNAAVGVDVVIGEYENLSDEGKIGDRCRVYPDEKDSLFKSLFSVSCLWTKLISRDFIIKNELSFDPDMKIGEDVVFLANLATKAPKYRVVDALVYYHCHHDTAVFRSLTHIYTLDAFKKHIECRERVLSICSELPEARDYVYNTFSHFITEFIPKVQDAAEREAVFALYKSHMMLYDFDRKKALFRCIAGVEYDEFVSMNVYSYLEKKSSVLPREQVLWELECGRLGLRWIIRYFKAWLKYKFKKS